jgi:CBS domain-containing protein
MKTSIGDILASKGNDVLTIQQTATVYEAIEKMESNRVGSIIAMNGDTVAGIFTERDYLRRVVLRGHTSKTCPVADVMTEDLVCVDPDYTVEECMAIMTEKKIRHLPVMSNGRLTGIVSIGDLVKAISENAQARVRYLTEFVTGRYPA